MAEQARTFSPWSHVVSLLFAQLTHSLGLNDVCDALRLQSGPLSAIRGATPPGKSTLSHANRERDARLAQELFWAVLKHLQNLYPGFGGNSCCLVPVGATDVAGSIDNPSSVLRPFA